MHLGRLSVPQRLSLGAIGVVMISAFLPWVSIFGVGATGIEGDGVITLVLALVGALVLLFTSGAFGGSRTPGKVSQISLLVLAILVALVGLLDMNGAAAIGLYLTLFAGIAWVAGAVWQLSTKATAATAS